MTRKDNIQTIEQARCPTCKRHWPEQETCKTCNGTGNLIRCGCDVCEEDEPGRPSFTPGTEGRTAVIRLG